MLDSIEEKKQEMITVNSSTVKNECLLANCNEILEKENVGQHPPEALKIAMNQLMEALEEEQTKKKDRMETLEMKLGELSITYKNANTFRSTTDQKISSLGSILSHAKYVIQLLQTSQLSPEDFVSSILTNIRESELTNF